MATTTYTTWTQMFRSATFENGYDADPNNDLELTEEKREAFLSDCCDHLENEVDKLLAPFGATILGNGDIVGPVKNLGAFQDALEEGDLREEISMIDFDPIIARYL